MERMKEKEKKSECGYMQVGRGGHGDKKNYFGWNHFPSIHFRSTLILSTTRPYMWAFKRCFVKWVGGLILVRNVLECFNFYSIDALLI